jgi:hydrogenase expression/formation protein HypC
MCLAIPGKIISIYMQADSTFRLGKVSFGGIIKDVNLLRVPETIPGDYVLVSVGIAISKINEEDARKTFERLRKSGEVEALVGERDQLFK